MPLAQEVWHYQARSDETMTTKIAAIQMEPILMDREANLSAIERAMRHVAASGARLAIFPEAAVTGYCYESVDEALPFAESADGPSAERLTPLCRELDLFVIFGTLEQAGASLFNAALLVGPEGLLGVYRKTHLPFLGIDRFTNHGNEPYQIHQAGELRVGMLICYDGGFPEASRALTLAGADLIALPTNWPSGAICAAEHLTNARALENGVYFAAVDRIGTERGFAFIGRSRICDPFGATIADAPHDQAAILYADVDPARARQKRHVRSPGINEVDRIADRRPELYGALVEPVVDPTPRR